MIGSFLRPRRRFRGTSCLTIDQPFNTFPKYRRRRSLARFPLVNDGLCRRPQSVRPILLVSAGDVDGPAKAYEHNLAGRVFVRRAGASEQIESRTVCSTARRRPDPAQSSLLVPGSETRRDSRTSPRGDRFVPRLAMSERGRGVRSQVPGATAADAGLAVVVHNQMSVEVGRDLRVDRVEKLQELVTAMPP
jgi:hypothetical protein